MSKAVCIGVSYIHVYTRVYTYIRIHTWFLKDVSSVLFVSVTYGTLSVSQLFVSPSAFELIYAYIYMVFEGYLVRFRRFSYVWNHISQSVVRA